MWLAAFIVFLSTQAVESYLAGSTIESYSPDKSKLVEASIDILESCYMERFSTVGLVGPSIDHIMKGISSRDTVVPVITINETSSLSGPESGHKLQVFIVTAIDLTQLEADMKRVRDSGWWNHMASFLLIESSGINRGCSNAYEFLWKAWKMDLINSKFMCLDPTRGTLIYTFNPYTSKAPVPWQRENTYPGIKGHVWTLLVREYRKDEPHCDTLDFDKTLDLGGYELNAVIIPAENSTMEWESYVKVVTVTYQVFMDSLNVTWKLTPIRAFDETIGTSNVDDLVYTEALRNVDIILDVVTDSDKFTHATYPHLEVSLAILTQYRGHKSQLEKIISVLDKSSRFGVIVVLLITLSFFKCCLCKPIIPAMLDLVLITTNAALFKIPKKLGARIYLGSLFIFVVTIQGIYQGLLASLLTSEVRLQNINSIEDLAKSDHRIYGWPDYTKLFNDSAFEGRYITSYDSIEVVRHDPKAACIGPKIVLIAAARRYKLYLSDETINVGYGVTFIRSNWPLEQRVNANLQIIFASGIVDLLRARIVESDENSLKLNNYQYQHQGVKVMTLKSLGFAWVILAFGLACAAITFIIEVAIFDTAIAKPRKSILRRIRLTK